MRLYYPDKPQIKIMQRYHDGHGTEYLSEGKCSNYNTILFLLSFQRPPPSEYVSQNGELQRFRCSNTACTNRRGKKTNTANSQSAFERNNERKRFSVLAVSSHRHFQCKSLFGSHPNPTIQPDHLPIQHHILNDMFCQRSILHWSSQSRRERHLLT